MLSTLIILTFFLKRAIAIYFPLKLLNHNFKKAIMLKYLTASSFLSTFYVMVFIEKVPLRSGLPKNSALYSELVSLNMTTNFNLLSLATTYEQSFCSFSYDHMNIMLKLHSLNFIVILLAYLLISISILLIICKLKRQQRSSFTVVYRSTRFHTNSGCQLTRRTHTLEEISKSW
jgi:hypothetical protein